MLLIDNFVITNIEVANIVCDVDNLLISWWLMHRGNLATSCEPTICVMWKTCDSVWSVNRHSVWCGKHATLCYPSSDIVCGVETLLNCVWCGKHATLCDPSTDIWDSVWCGKHATLRDPLTDIWDFVWCGKLTHIIVYHVPWKTYSHHRVSCTVENLLTSSCIMYRKTYSHHRVSCTVENLFT